MLLIDMIIIFFKKSLKLVIFLNFFTFYHENKEFKPIKQNYLKKLNNTFKA